MIEFERLPENINDRIDVFDYNNFKDCLRKNNVATENNEMLPPIAKLYGLPVYEKSYVPKNEAWLFSGNKMVRINLN